LNTRFVNQSGLTYRVVIGSGAYRPPSVRHCRGFFGRRSGKELVIKATRVGQAGGS
jgi:hypothetical protein